MKAGQYTRGRGDINAYAFKNRSKEIPFYVDWLEDLRGGSATEDMPVIEIQTAGDEGLAGIYSRGFLVARASANYTHYLLFGREEMQKILDQGAERMLVCDKYISADEFRTMDKPMGTPIIPMETLDVELPAVEVRRLPIANKGDVTAALLVDVWKAFFDRFERGGRCLIPIGCVITPSEKTVDIWTDSMAMIRSVREYLPRPVWNIISVTAGADWSRFNAQTGSAWYICRDENVNRGQREGLYDFVRNSHMRRCSDIELELGRALLSGKEMRFYKHICETGKADSTGGTCLCYDAGFAVNLYALQCLLDNPSVAMDEKINSALNAWRNLDNALTEYEKRGRLTAKQHCYALLPVMEEITALLKGNDLPLTLNQSRLLISALLNPDMPDARSVGIRANIEAILYQRSMLRNGKNSILQVMTSSQDFFQFGMWKSQTNYPVMIGRWLMAQRTQTFLNEDEQTGLVDLAVKEKLGTIGLLGAQVNNFCAESIKAHPSKERLHAVLNMLIKAQIPSADAEGEALKEQISAALCANFEQVVLPEKAYSMIGEYIRLNGTKVDVPAALIDHLLVILKNGSDANVFSYFCKVAVDYPRVKELAELKQSFEAWMDEHWKSRQYSDDEIKDAKRLLKQYPKADFDEVLARPAVHSTRERMTPGQTAYLRKVLETWPVSPEKIVPSTDFADYLLRVYGNNDIQADELKDILELQNPRMIEALYIHSMKRLEMCAAWRNTNQPMDLLMNRLTLKCEDAATLFGFMKRCQENDRYANETMIQSVCRVLNRGSIECENLWMDFAGSGLSMPKATEEGVRQAKALRDAGLISSQVSALTDAVIGFMEKQNGANLQAEEAFIAYMGKPEPTWNAEYIKRTAICMGASYALHGAEQTKSYMTQFMAWAPENLENGFADHAECVKAWKNVRSGYVSEAFVKSVVAKMKPEKLSAQSAKTVWSQDALFSWMKGTAAGQTAEQAWTALEGYLTQGAREKLAVKAAQLMDSDMGIAQLQNAYSVVCVDANQGDWFGKAIEKCLNERFAQQWMDQLTEGLRNVDEAEALKALYSVFASSGSWKGGASKAKQAVDFACSFRKELKDAQDGDFTKAGEAQLGRWMSDISDLDKSGTFRWGRVAVKLAKGETAGKEGHWTVRMMSCMDVRADSVQADWDKYLEKMLDECESGRTWDEQKKDPWHEESGIIQLLLWQAARLENDKLKGSTLAADFDKYLKSDGMQATMAKIRNAHKEAKEFSGIDGYRTIFGGNK